MKIIDGKNATLGRLASYAAKESLKGEEIIIVNCEKIIITGNKKNIKEWFEKKKGRIGSSQKGPKYSMTNEKIVKRTIRGMLPDHRKGRGKIAYKKIKCYLGLPEKFKENKIMESGKKKKNKFSELREFTK
jgi:large subunit ribosomal protein L13